VKFSSATPSARHDNAVRNSIQDICCVALSRP
jgi:hypothetical protein